MMKERNFVALFCALMFCGVLSAQNETSFPHWQQWEQYSATGLDSEAEWDDYHGIVASPTPRTSACNLNQKVYGWHPYWMGTAYNNYDWDLLSTFSYFSYEVNPNTGNYNSIHSWKTTNSINLAQAAGCKVELSVTLFGGTNNTTFLTNPTARQTLIDSLIALVQYRNADGVNIDFEGVPGAQRANFTSFMQSLSIQLKGAVSGATLTMALYAVDWNNVFDIPALDPYLDEFIIMGYGYHYSGSATAGPTAPAYSGSIWWAYNLNRSILYYLDEGVTPSKLLVGLPYYGNEYTTTSGAVPSSTTGFVGSRTFSYMKANLENIQPRVWDPHSFTPAWIFQTGGVWHQAWVDDVEGLEEKFDLVHHRNIGGIGIWALGYDNGYTELWDLIRDKFSDCGAPLCADTLYDTGGPLGDYRDNEDYSFTIQSPAGQQVTIDFPVFDVELNWDYLYIYDGPTTGSPLIGQFTGTTNPGPITSTGDALTFRFTSDGATRTPGFELAWHCENPTTYGDTIYLNRNDSARLNCGISYHTFFDSDNGPGANYDDNENYTMTFCAPNAGDAVRLSFLMQTSPIQLDLKSTVNGNDFLSFFDGPDTNSPVLGVYTGSTSNYPQPGTVISTDECLTVHFESDGSSNGDGWEARLRCVAPPADSGTFQIAQGASLHFTDSGDSTAAYDNNESYIKTYCPDAAALAAGKVIWADFLPMEIEQNYDYLHVYDGPDRSARLLCTYTGNSLHQNDPFLIKATNENPSGCLTFEFYSDGGTVKNGWSAQMTTGNPRRAYGTEHCVDATLISVASEPYAGSTTLAHGAPNAEDPPLNVSIAGLPECSGANAITRLENSIWFKFVTPSTLCSSSNINLLLQNISCQNSIPGGNGAQFMLYESATCQTGSGWGSPIYCADKLLDGVPVNVAGLLNPSSTYYILVDGFAGQHCNLDLMITGDINGCILPIELVNFEGELREISAELWWETENESNNAGFFVDRGRRGWNGGLEFEEIGFVDAQTGSKHNFYGYSDSRFVRNATNWYRLRQLDLDGQIHHHQIIRLGEEAATGLSVEVFPNPAEDGLHIALSGAASSETQVQLIDLTGKILSTQSIPQNETQITLSVSEFPAGLYLWRVNQEGKALTGKWMKR